MRYNVYVVILLCFFHKGPLIGFQQLVYSTDEEGGMFLDVCVELLSSGTHPNPIPFSMSTAPGTAVGKTASYCVMTT